MKSKPVKILIVDDNEELAATIRDYFESNDLGISPLITSDSTEVISILEENPDVKLILSDFYMPGMNGIDLLMAVREKYPNMLFVMMTGYHSAELQDQGLEHGAVRFFKKPFSISDLISFIQEALSESIAGFDGTIDSIQLPDIVQLIALGRRNVEVELTSERGSGSIFFRNGEIIHAACDGLKGEDAFYEMFTWIGGQFNVKALSSDVDRTIEQTWQGLVLEAARRKDEAKAIADGELTIVPDQETGYQPEVLPGELEEATVPAPDGDDTASPDDRAGDDSKVEADHPAAGDFQTEEAEQTTGTVQNRIASHDITDQMISGYGITGEYESEREEKPDDDQVGTDAGIVQVETGETGERDEEVRGLESASDVKPGSDMADQA
ncbi:MAG TPA: DUF4388 domain-containing protein, partial [Bacteroidetes bacterium]|nr:DUF4388 domain-containing protein [Bacteroidota bacterium]